MGMVHTQIGLVERDRLTVEEIVTEDANSRSIATEWRLDGRLVKRDAHVIILSGQALMGEQEAI